MSSPPAVGTLDPVQCVAFAVPLLPGQAEADRMALASCQAGARREAHQDARRRAGIIREAVWIQPTPGGDVAVVYLEADDLAAAFTKRQGDRALASGRRPEGRGSVLGKLTRPDHTLSATEAP